MARELNITVGGEEARIRCSIAGEVLHIVTSKCYAEYAKLMKLATESKCEMPMPAGSDQVRPPLAPGQPVRPAICMKDMGAFNADMPMRFPDNADKHIKAFLAGEDVPKDFDSKPVVPGEAKMFTIEEVQAIAKESAKQALEAAGHIAKAQPVAELDVKPEMILAGDGEKLAGLADGDLVTGTPPEYDTTGWSQNQKAFAKMIIEGTSVDEAVENLGYKTKAAGKAALTRFKKVPAIANLIEQMENAE